MVANSVTSAKSGKRNTKKTNAVTQEEAIQILQQSVILCMEAGIEVELMPSQGGHGQTTLLAMRGVVLANQQLVLVKNGKDQNGQTNGN